MIYGGGIEKLRDALDNYICGKWMVQFENDESRALGRERIAEVGLTTHTDTHTLFGQRTRTNTKNTGKKEWKLGGRMGYLSKRTYL